jgi:carbamate kinase
MAYQKGIGKNVVIALGGNALGDTPEQQIELVAKTAAHIVDMVAEGVNVVVSHGNGPQVGMINNAFAYASSGDGKTPEIPFPECGAMSQGYIGYHLSQAILCELKRRGIMRSAATIVTQTVVYPEDPAFGNPTKPVGAFLTEEQAKAKMAETGLTYKEDSGRGWRLVVASPKPQRIVEFDAVRDLMAAGYIVIAGGGGGVPVVERNDSYRGVPAVIDKDRSSAKMAADFKADMLIILTAVEKVAVNFNKPGQRSIDRMTVAEARRHIEDGQFAPGSMLPKVQACIEYLESHPSGVALVTSLEKASAGLRGETGTVIVSAAFGRSRGPGS